MGSAIAGNTTVCVVDSIELRVRIDETNQVDIHLVHVSGAVEGYARPSYVGAAPSAAAGPHDPVIVVDLNPRTVVADRIASPLVEPALYPSVAGTCTRSYLPPTVATNVGPICGHVRVVDARAEAARVSRLAMSSFILVVCVRYVGDRKDGHNRQKDDGQDDDVLIGSCILQECFQRDGTSFGDQAFGEFRALAPSRSASTLIAQ